MILDILFLSIIALARPPDESIRTTEDQRLDEACSIYLNQGVDYYASCVAEKGRVAEQERRRQENSRRMQDINEGPASPRVCNIEGAIRACQKESAATLNILNSQYPSDSAVVQSLQSCRAACNPSSAQVLRNFLGGCTNDISSVQQTMLTTMNNCGATTAATTVVSSVIPQGVRNLISSDMSIGDKLNAGAQRLLGYSWNPAAGTVSNAIMSTEGTQLSRGVRYMQVNIGGIQTYGYCAVDSSCYQTYDEAAKASAPLLVRGGRYDRSSQLPKSDVNFDADPLFVGDESLPGNKTSDMDEIVNSGSSDENITNDEDIQNDSRQNLKAESSNGEDSKEIDNSLKPNKDVPSDVEEIHYKYNSNSSLPKKLNISYGEYQGLQNAFVKNSSNMSNVNISSYQPGEATRGYSAGGIKSINQFAQSNNQHNIPRILNNQPNQFGTPPNQQGNSSLLASPQQRPRAGLPFGNSFSSRPISVASRKTNYLTGSPQVNLHQNEFYSRSSGGYITNQKGKFSYSCTGPKCRNQARRPRVVNCDGNPQCILALTGKLKMHRAQRALAYEKNARFFPQSGQQARGISSINGKIEPGGIVRRRTIDILHMLDNSEVLKLDHEGFLELD